MNCTQKGCPAIRPGSTACHCAGCHETFGTLTSFDAHRPAIGSGAPCKTPEALGLVFGNGAWRTPEGLQGITRKTGNLALARERRAA